MTEIKDVFIWYRGLPVMPRDLTTIQMEEWQERESANLLRQPFIGKTLSPSPATISDISRDAISASAFYALDYNVTMDGTRCFYHKNTRVASYAYVAYAVSYEKEKYLDNLHSIKTGEMVELSGVIKSVRWLVVEDPSIYTGQYQLHIQLSLLSITKTNPRFLHAELLDESLHYEERGCFVATAAFNADDCIEVMTLRKYRDNYLSSRIIGRSFIKVYYLLSPLLSQIIGASSTLRCLTRYIIRRSILPLINHRL